MSSTYSPNLGIQLIGSGDQAGAWGNTTNVNLGTLIEDAISGYVTYSCSGGTDVITIPDGASGVARNMFIQFSGTGGGTVEVPAKRKLYFIFNSTASAVTVKVNGQTGVSVPAGAKQILVNNGTDVITGLNYISALTVANLTASGTAASLSSVIPNIAEPTTISATAATGTINYDVTTQSIIYYTSNASANWTVNFRGSSGTSLNTVMATGQTITLAFLVTQGTTAYYNNVITIDGVSVTPKYTNGVAWIAGTPSGIDSYTYTIIKTGSAAFTVLATQTSFK
jgi:hypothetical protein